jgi:predicted alpha/beta superfamily hydrolase
MLFCIGSPPGNAYLDFLESTVVPYVQRRYRVRVGQQDLAILGSSLGGLISCE